MGGPPWKCEDCGTWWSGLEHRCQPTVDSTGTGAPFVPFDWPTIARIGGTTYGACTCPLNRGDNYTGFCPIHDVRVTM